MPRAIYRGPGDSVELDGISIEKGKGADLSVEQISRIAASDPEAVIDVKAERGERPERTAAAEKAAKNATDEKKEG